MPTSMPSLRAPRREVIYDSLSCLVTHAVTVRITVAGLAIVAAEHWTGPVAAGGIARHRHPSADSPFLGTSTGPQAPVAADPLLPACARRYRRRQPSGIDDY